MPLVVALTGSANETLGDCDGVEDSEGAVVVERLAATLREAPSVTVTGTVKDAAATLGVSVADAADETDGDNDTEAAAFVPVGDVDTVRVWP